MSHTASSTVNAVTHYSFRLFSIALLLALLCVTAGAQTPPSSASSDGITPIGMKPGAPAGSYALSGFDNVNYFSGLMNFHLPLLSVGGRGAAGYTMMLAIQQTWQVRHIRQPSGCGPGGCTGPTIHTYVPDPNPWEIVQPGYGPGMMYIRYSGNNFTYVGGCTWFSETLTRVTFVGPDGTEYDLRDQLYYGQPKPNQQAGGQCNTGYVSRGRVFTTYDGSGVTFISDTVISDPSMFTNPQQDSPSGYLLLKDGTRYRINGGLVDWIQDREGNRVSFTYSLGRVTAITDSLGRQVTIEYNVTDPTYGVCDRIHLNGVGGTPRTIFVRRASLGDALRSGYSLQSLAQLFPSLNGASSSGQFNGGVVSGVVLPDGRQYQFQYNSYRDLARVVLPTGGAYEYDYVTGSGVYASGLGSDNTADYGVNRRVTERRVYADGSTLEGKTTFTRSAPATIVDRLSPAGSLLAREEHYFYGDPLTSLGTPNSYPTWQQGKEYKTELYDIVGTATLKKSVTNTFMQRALLSWWTGAQDGSPANDPRQIETVMTFADTNQVSKTTSINPANGSVGFDQYNNPTDSWEFDFGAGAPSTYPVRHTHTDYLTYNSANSLSYDTVNPNTSSPDPAATIHVRGLPVAQQVYAINPANGVETLVAQSTTAYDESAYPVLTYASVTGWAAPGTAGRGNPTTASRWLNTTGAWLSTHAQYDQAGNVRVTWDAKGNQAQIAYSDSYSDNIDRNTYAHPTSATSPVPDPTGAHGSSTAFTTTAKYDYSTGLMTSQTDPNGQTSTLAYNDPLDRPTQMVRAVAAAQQNQTTVAYDDTNHVITTTSDQVSYNDNALKSQTIYDGLGRTTEARQYEGGTNYIVVQTQYDALGRAYKTSNPFRPWRSETAVWTTTAYDALSRVTSVTTPDGATVASSYSGNTVTVSDQTSKQRKSVSDALGRLIQVYEAPNGLSYLTSYSYDALDNLTGVSQVDPITSYNQTRTFVYDSLKRLTSAANPESGTVSYNYDANGNLLSKTDARSPHVTTTLTYDAINRPTAKSYNDGTSAVSYYYDNASLPSGAPTFSRGYSTGRLVAVTYGGSSAGDYYGYDAAGRSVLKIQQTGSVNYQTTATYNLAGAVLTETYPSNRTVTNTYDGAGRTTSVTGYLGDGTQRTYSTGIIYSSLSGMTKEQFGTTTPIYNKLFYNVRGQLGEIRDSTSYTGPTDTTWNRGAIINHYSNNYGCWGASCNAPDNNGNLMKQEVYIPADDQISSYTTRWQQYDYDSLNRINWVREVAGGAEVWRQTFTYDRYGGRTIDQTNTYGTGIPKPNFTVNTANNRLGVPSGQSGTMTYDNAGNLTTDTYSAAAVTRAYDAENRMKSETQANNYVAGSYTYDGDGRRVKRIVNGTETRQVYGLAGELLAEYAATNPAAASPQKEYGYRNGQLLITADAASGGGGPVTWTNAVGVTVNGNSLTSTGNGWNTAGAVSTQSIASGDGYVETTVSETNTYRMIGLSHGNTNQNYDDIDFGFFLNANGTIDVYEGGVPRGVATNYATGNVLRVAVEGGVVKYRKNGTLIYTSTVAPTYPLLVDTSLYSNGSTLNNVVISGAGGGGSSAQIHWLVSDQLGTPRMIFDQSGSLATVSRHDYLPFGEELFAGTGGRTAGQGYSASDGIRQHFTLKERDIETGLDFFEARYFSSTQGRFTSVDPIVLTVKRLYDPQQINLYAYTRNNPLAFIDPTGETIDFANDDSKKKFDDYVKYLNEDKDKHAKELATVMQLQASDVNYVVNVAEHAGSGEGETTTDGKQIFLNINNVGGPAGETFSMNSRFAHEFDHGRQFDNGEFAFRKNDKGEWQPDSYDIHDEVRAFEAQQRTSTDSDYFTHKHGENRPSSLSQFANAKTEDEKAGVLARNGYPGRIAKDNKVYAGSTTGYKPGDLIRPTDNGPIKNYFGRVNYLRK